MSTDHPNLEVIKFTVVFEDGKTAEVAVKGNDDIHFQIPEGVSYQMTIHFVVKGKTLTNLKYKQEVSKFGMVVKRRELDIGAEFEPRDEPYEKEFETDVVPKSFISLKGEFPCKSTYYADGEVLFVAPWRLTVT